MLKDDVLQKMFSGARMSCYLLMESIIITSSCGDKTIIYSPKEWFPQVRTILAQSQSMPLSHALSKDLTPWELENFVTKRFLPLLARTYQGVRTKSALLGGRKKFDGCRYERVRFTSKMVALTILTGWDERVVDGCSTITSRFPVQEEVR